MGIAGIVAAIAIPLVLLLMYSITVPMQNSAQLATAVYVPSEYIQRTANNTAITLGHTLLADPRPTNKVITFLNGSDSKLVTGVNYSVDTTAGTLTWTANGATLENNSGYLISYSYYPSNVNNVWSSTSSGTSNAYQMSNIYPIAMIGVAILGSILGVLGGLFVMGRR